MTGGLQMPVDNSDYLDPDSFTNSDDVEPDITDTCDLCGVTDTRDNWLIFQRETFGFICQKCIENNHTTT